MIIFCLNKDTNKIPNKKEEMDIIDITTIFIYELFLSQHYFLYLCVYMVRSAGNLALVKSLIND